LLVGGSTPVAEKPPLHTGVRRPAGSTDPAPTFWRAAWQVACNPSHCMAAAMRVGYIFVLGLVLCPPLGSAESGVRQSDGTTLGLFTTFQDHPCAPSTLQEMRLELEDILSPLGFHLEWRSETDNPPGEAFNYIVSVHFRGNCLPEAPWGVTPEVDKLGGTHITDGNVLPFGEVNIDAVRRTTWPLLIRDGAAQATVLLGRALARVLAHEVYHMLARTQRHTWRGLAKRRLTAHELVVDPVRFGAPELVKMRTPYAIPLSAVSHVPGCEQGAGSTPASATGGGRPGCGPERPVARPQQ